MLALLCLDWETVLPYHWNSALWNPFLEMLETFLSVNSFGIISVSLIISNLIHSFLFISHLNFIANHHWVSNTILAPHSPSWTNLSYTCLWLLRSRSWTNLSMALGSVYFSLNISTTMPFKDVLKWIFVARFFRRPLCFDATGIGKKISDTNQAPSNDLIHVCIFLGSPSSLKSLTMMSWIKNLSYSFAEASPSFTPNIIIAMVVRPWVPNRVVVWPWIPNIIIATPSLWQGFHVVIHALHNPPGMSSSSICDSMASATATTCIRNIDYI